MQVLTRIGWPPAYALVVDAQLPSNEETDRRFAAFRRTLRPQLGDGAR